jgi:hypothetical protein
MTRLISLVQAGDITRTYHNGTVEIIPSTSLLSPSSGSPSIFPKIEANWTLTVFTSTQTGICSEEWFEDTAIGGHSCISIPGGDGGNDTVKFDAGGQYQIEFYEDGQCEEFVRLLGPTNKGNCEELGKKVGSYVLYHVGVET